MSTNRIVRIVAGLILVGYGIYSGNAWFYLGVLPLVAGLVNWCPLEMKMGTCDSTSGCCATPNKVEDESSCCTPIGEVAPQNIHTFSTAKIAKMPNDITQILILGTGCAKCVTLKHTVDEAIKTLNGNFKVEKVEDIEEIMSYGVVGTPGLVINGKVKSTGKALSLNEVVKLIETEIK